MFGWEIEVLRIIYTWIVECSIYQSVKDKAHWIHFRSDRERLVNFTLHDNRCVRPIHYEFIPLRIRTFKNNVRGENFCVLCPLFQDSKRLIEIFILSLYIYFLNWIFHQKILRLTLWMEMYRYNIIHDWDFRWKLKFCLLFIHLSNYSWTKHGFLVPGSFLYLLQYFNIEL